MGHHNRLKLPYATSSLTLGNFIGEEDVFGKRKYGPCSNQSSVYPMVALHKNGRMRENIEIGRILVPVEGDVRIPNSVMISKMKCKKKTNCIMIFIIDFIYILSPKDIIHRVKRRWGKYIREKVQKYFKIKKFYIFASNIYIYFKI